MTALAGVSSRLGQPVIERASPSDRAFLAMDTADVPEQFGVILTLGEAGGLDLGSARRLIAGRLPAVPRLRQRLVRAPFGCGGPVWADDPGFDISRHVRTVACLPPADEQALLDAALSVIMSPLPRDAPLWSAVLVTGLADGTTALVLVLHHALADGVGGLAVLTGLVDGAAGPPEACSHEHAVPPVTVTDGTACSSFPRPAPARAALARQAWLVRLAGLRHAARSWHLLRASMCAGGGLRPPRATPCSLNQRTGTRRQLAVVRVSLAAVREAAHQHGATANDALLVAVTGALHRVLLARGESIGALVVTVPVSGREAGGGHGTRSRREDGVGHGTRSRREAGGGHGSEPALGNMVSPMLVSVPATGDLPDRLRQVAAQVRAHKAAAPGPPPIAVLGWLFRPLAALGGFRWYMNHQHRFHTLVTNVRGPTEPVTFARSPVISAVPVGVGPGGNIPVHFEVLSYAGTLTLTATADPGRFPDLGALADALRTELDLIIGHPAAWPAS
jgi:WS/DGAT/MGAT family acyltransferase